MQNNVYSIINRFETKDIFKVGNINGEIFFEYFRGKQTCSFD
jgi:hypothetical protein